MVSCVNNQGEQTWITNAMDFRNCMSEDAFNAMVEFFGVSTLGDGNYIKEIENLKCTIDDLEYEIIDKESEAENAERDAEDALNDVKDTVKDLRDAFQEQYEKMSKEFENALEEIRRHI